MTSVCRRVNRQVGGEGQLTVQSDRDDGTSLVGAVIEGNTVIGRSNSQPGDGPTMLLSRNNSGWVVRENVCDGKPCGVFVLKSDDMATATAGATADDRATGFLLRFYALFAAVAAAVLGPHLLGVEPAPYQSGWAVASLVGAHQLAFAATCPTAAGGGSALQARFQFAAVLSVFQVVPDLFLDAVLGALHFPADGCPRLFGRVSAYMAGMWTIPILWILHLSDRDHRDVPAGTKPMGATRSSPTALPTTSEALTAAALALVVFGSAEELTFPLGLWHATGVVKHTRGHVALYVLPAEALLGAAALVGHRASSGGGIARKATAAAGVALLYTGALAVSFLFVEELQVFGVR